MSRSVYVASPEGLTGKSAVALGLLDDHLKHCVLDAALAGGPVSEQRLGEASEAIARLVRS